MIEWYLKKKKSNKWDLSLSYCQSIISKWKVLPSFSTWTVVYVLSLLELPWTSLAFPRNHPHSPNIEVDKNGFSAGWHSRLWGSLAPPHSPLQLTCWDPAETADPLNTKKRDSFGLCIFEKYGTEQSFFPFSGKQCSFQQCFTTPLNWNLPAELWV